MNENRGPWYLLTGVLIGIAIGIIYAWVLSPVEYVDTIPSSLRSDFKDEYRILIALAYAANGDLARAQARLQLLEDVGPAEVIAAQAQRANASGRSSTEVRALGLLAGVADSPNSDIPTAIPLTQYPTASLTPTQTPTAAPSFTPSITPTSSQTPSRTPTTRVTVAISQTPESTSTSSPTLQPSRTPSPTASPPSTRTLTPTPGNPFVLDSRRLTCKLQFAGPLIIVRAFDSEGDGVPGVEVILSWDSSEEHFFTGLKPEFGLGYADFLMSPGTVYTLRLADGSQLIPDLTAARCEAETGQEIWGTWELNFISP